MIGGHGEQHSPEAEPGTRPPNSRVLPAAISDPANTVLVYEGKDGKLNFHHNGRAAVAFADGRARLIGGAEAKNLRRNP